MPDEITQQSQWRAWISIVPTQIGVRLKTDAHAASNENRVRCQRYDRHPNQVDEMHISWQEKNYTLSRQPPQSSCDFFPPKTTKCQKYREFATGRIIVLEQ
jgi:hypothetical protein